MFYYIVNLRLSLFKRQFVSDFRNSNSSKLCFLRDTNFMDLVGYLDAGVLEYRSECMRNRYEFFSSHMFPRYDGLLIVSDSNDINKIYEFMNELYNIVYSQIFVYEIIKLKDM